MTHGLRRSAAARLLRSKASVPASSNRLSSLFRLARQFRWHNLEMFFNCYGAPRNLIWRKPGWSSGGSHSATVSWAAMKCSRTAVLFTSRALLSALSPLNVKYSH